MFRLNDIEIDIIKTAIDKLKNNTTLNFDDLNRIETKFKLSIPGLKTFVMTNSATSALISILLYLKAKIFNTDFRVLIPGYSHPSAISACEFLGIDYDFIDVAKDKPIISLKQLQEYNLDYDVVIYQELFGYPLEDEIYEYLHNKGKIVIEDAAQAIFSKNNSGKYAGTIGDFGFYSFSSFKLLSVGEGGAIISKEDYQDDFKDLIFQGGWYHYNREKFKFFVNPGNIKMSNILSLILETELDNLEYFLDKYQNEYNYLYSKFKNKLINDKNKLTSYFAFKINNDNELKLYSKLKLSKYDIKPHHYKNMAKILFNQSLKNSDMWEQKLIILQEK